MYTVYIIKSREGYSYTGQTVDLKLRLDQHNSGISKWTKRGNDWKVIYEEKFETRKEAQLRESYFKTGIGREYIAKKISNLK